MKNSKFWDGWVEAVDAMDTRLQALQREMNSHTKAYDLLLDFKNEINELQSLYLNLTTKDS